MAGHLNRDAGFIHGVFTLLYSPAVCGYDDYDIRLLASCCINFFDHCTLQVMARFRTNAT